MTLTVVVGSSGSGKTTFLNDVYKSYKCTYIRQYHNMRPYIKVKKIPHFDPSRLPFWDIYVSENKADAIQAGGTMAGKFTAGLSGGQRKLLLFELICQRVADQADLLIALDEPFGGVTDDFVPFITERLREMAKKHNIVLVTNDHVQTLTEMADNTITVSAIDRSTVHINNREAVDRTKAIAALSVGDQYHYKASSADVQFFLDTELYHSGDLMGIAIFTTIVFALFLGTFWDSPEDNGALVLVAGGTVSFFCANPYLLSLVEWRNAMLEEAEALVHASKGLNKIMKTCLALSLIAVISLIEYGVVNAVINGFEDVKFWVAMFFDSSSLTFALIGVGLFTRLPQQSAQILGQMPFLLMIFVSTTFSPGAGIPVLKELRYIYARFYFWCMVPSVQGLMEGCPPSNLNLLYLILSALVFLFIFLVFMSISSLRKSRNKTKAISARERLMDDAEFQDLQLELYGERALRHFQHMGGSSRSLSKVANAE